MDIIREIADLEQQREQLYINFQEINEKIQTLNRIKSIKDDLKTTKLNRRLLKDELQKIVDE
jgi:hypothetical protein